MWEWNEAVPYHVPWRPDGRPPHGLDGVGAGRSGKETKHHGTDHPEQQRSTEFWEWGVDQGALSPSPLKSANSRNLAGRAL